MLSRRLQSIFVIALLLLLLIPEAKADVYNRFVTERYYSANRRYVIKVNASKEAALYRRGRHLRRIWKRKLPQLPGELLVSNDGKRIVIVDRAYGNYSDAATPVVIILDERGRQIESHSLGEVADLSRVQMTTSSAHWYDKARLTLDGKHLVIETQIAKVEREKCQYVASAEEADEYWKSIPHERLQFATATGQIVTRIKLADAALPSNASRK